jgi:hypothetical protein
LIQLTDRDQFLFPTLEALTESPVIEETRFNELLEYMENNTLLNHIIVVVIEILTGRIVATGTVVIEKHLTGKVGYVENIAVHKSQ